MGLKVLRVVFQVKEKLKKKKSQKTLQDYFDWAEEAFDFSTFGDFVSLITCC